MNSNCIFLTLTAIRWRACPAMVPPPHLRLPLAQESGGAMPGWACGCSLWQSRSRYGPDCKLNSAPGVPTRARGLPRRHRRSKRNVVVLLPRPSHLSGRSVIFRSPSCRARGRAGGVGGERRGGVQGPEVKVMGVGWGGKEAKCCLLSNSLGAGPVRERLTTYGIRVRVSGFFKWQYIIF
jgi:hypothetical protein